MVSFFHTKVQRNIKMTALEPKGHASRAVTDREFSAGLKDKNP